MDAPHKDQTRGYGSIAESSSPPPTPMRSEFDATQQGLHLRRKLIVSLLAFCVALLGLTIHTNVHRRRTNRSRKESISDLHHLRYPTEPEMMGLASSPSRWNQEYFYDKQLVDHFTDSCTDEKTTSSTWSQRYFASSEYFHGPGHPIFLIISGEADDTTGLLYEYIARYLAKRFKAYVVQPEHRFYGKSQPKGSHAKNHDLSKLLTVDQAIADLIQIAQHIRKHELGCSLDHSSAGYCPLIAVGGSYPARLAAMMRIAHPDIVDIAYASSSPLLGFPGFIKSTLYYDHITDVAEKASPGCANAVKRTLLDVVDALSSSQNNEEGLSFKEAAESMGICVNTIPKYISTNRIFTEEVMMLVGNIFAEYNMDFYPPSDEKSFIKACKVFQEEISTTFEKMRSFFLKYATENQEESGNGSATISCFDLMTMLGIRDHATISTSDWTGAGGGNAADMWDFQGCYEINTHVGFSKESMFPERKWSLEWMTDHCWRRFHIAPQFGTLVNKYYGVNDLLAREASRIIFTNGLNDGWSVCGSVMESLSDTIVALNFPNGTHHSDLSARGPASEITDDIKNGRIQIADILGRWLEEIKDGE